MHNCCKRAWLACAVDSEGTIQLWKQASKNMPTQAFGIGLHIYNTDRSYIAYCEDILKSWGVRYALEQRRHGSLQKKNVVYTVLVRELASVIVVLQKIIPSLINKRSFALAVLGLALSRKASRGEAGERAPWTHEQIQLALDIRATYMPNCGRGAVCANEEALPMPCEASRVISCQAERSASSTSAGVETTEKTSTTNNSPQECPASLVDEEIVRSSGKLENGDKEPREDIAAA